MKQRYTGCSPMALAIPMWQRRIGWFLANLGNWIAGWKWGEDHYMRALMDSREMRSELCDDREG